MNEHEEKLVGSFIKKDKQERYLFLLKSPDPKRRQQCTEQLNHCRDLEEKHLTWLARNPRGSSSRCAEIAAQLRQKGSPAQVYLLSSASVLDGRTLPLAEALEITEREGWGTIVSCVPGQLAYFLDEEGERRAILERKPNP